jgi:hypothetical protein
VTSKRLQEREARVARLRAKAAPTRAARARADEEAYALWRGGHLEPWRISMALDSKGLEGPEVDIACGAQEPEVDLWEAGELYPTWEQVVALAELTGLTPKFLLFQTKHHEFNTSLRFHMPGYKREPPVLSFTPKAIREHADRLQQPPRPPA